PPVSVASDPRWYWVAPSNSPPGCGTSSSSTSALTNSAASTASGLSKVAVAQSSLRVLASLVNSHGRICPTGNPATAVVMKAPVSSLMVSAMDRNSSQVQSVSGISTPAASKTSRFKYMATVL